MISCMRPSAKTGMSTEPPRWIVVLMVVITLDGRATNIQVVKSPGLGLDEKAIEAVKNWKFEPAMKDGKPVAVQINVEVSFRLY